MQSAEERAVGGARTCAMHRLDVVEHSPLMGYHRRHGGTSRLGGVQQLNCIVVALATDAVLLAPVALIAARQCAALAWPEFVPPAQHVDEPAVSGKCSSNASRAASH